MPVNSAVISTMVLDRAPTASSWRKDSRQGKPGRSPARNVSIATGPTSEEGAFPSASGDTVFPSNGRFLFAGDFVQGTRTTSLPDATGVSFTVNLPFETMTCNVPLGLAINGTPVGTFSVGPGDTTGAGSFSFAALTGPTYTLRYERVSSSNWVPSIMADGRRLPRFTL